MDQPIKTETQLQLEKLNETIAKLRNGERISSVSYDGHSVSYVNITLAELLQEKQRLEDKLADETPGGRAKRQVIFATHKGARS